MGRRSLTLYLLLTIIVGLILVKIYVGATLGILNIQYATDQLQLTKLQQDNEILEEQVLHQESLSTIEQKARQQGFTDATILILHLGK